MRPSLFSTVLLATLAMAGAASACPVAAVQQAAASGGPPAAVQAYREVEQAGALCSAEERAWAGRVTATLHGAQAQRMIASGATHAAALLVVDEGLRYGRTWQLLWQRGDLLQRIPRPQGRPDFAAASIAFQEALNDIHDFPSEQPPSRENTERLVRLADQSRMAATSPVRLPRTRSGELGGLALREIRGFQVREVAQPIHFVWGSAEFADLGRAAADALFEMLQAENMPSIMLVGHTDPDGTNEYNMRLSRQRAEAVRQHLVQRGYPPARIATSGRGEEEPLQPAAQGIYSPEEFHQILRRVVLVRQ